MRPASISVVIPTHGRRASLLRGLAALGAQEFPLQDLEVVVVVDGSTDGTAEALASERTPFTLRVVEQPHLGAATARNRGAAAAAGRLLLFLDDDIEAAPSLVRAHERLHTASPGLVGLGNLRLVPPAPGGYFNEQLCDWGREMLDALARPGHRYRDRDLLSGHFSLEAALLSRVGGFDGELRCHEDYELGFRLLRSGARFRFLPDALATHHEVTDLPRALARKHQEGMADVQIGRRHPELRPTLLMARLAGRFQGAHRALARLAFSFPEAGDRWIGRVPRLLDALETLRLRWLWRRILYGPLEYWYWRGVARELGSLDELDRFVGRPRREAVDCDVEIDLRDGLEAAERRLDETRPSGVRLRYGSQAVGEIPPLPGAEPIGARHLRPRLCRELAWSLRKATRRQEGRSLSLSARRLLEQCPPDRIGVGRLARLRALLGSVRAAPGRDGSEGARNKVP